MRDPNDAATILIVDDSPPNCGFLAKRLQRHGYRCSEAYSGAAALQFIAAHGADLVLLDLMMPEMDGFEVLRRLRAQHDAASLPVLVVTARNQREDVVAAFADGANDYLEKPVDFAVLLARVQHQLRRKRLEDEVKASRARLEAQNRELQRVSRYKDNFLAAMSHELRTPLNVVIGFAEVLNDEQQGPLNPKQKQFCHEIQVSGRHLLQIINDLLDLSKIEAGRLELAPQPCDIAALLRAVDAMLQERAQRHGVTLSCTIATGIGQLHCDPLRIKQVLINLVGNALKFSAAGQRVELQAMRDADGALHLVVSDQGCGIAADDLERIFQPFEQARRPLQGRPAEGTGLGLALVQRLVELHGGRVEVHSAVGVGSRFEVILPDQRAGAAVNRG